MPRYRFGIRNGFFTSNQVSFSTFILGQTDIRECMPFLINRDNVI